MKVLIYGGGAREHSLVWKISSSPLLSKLYLARPNDGFAHLGEVIDAQNHIELAQKSKALGIDLLIVGPEEPLINGIVDEFRKVGIRSIGPDRKWAMLEGSKSFAKDFMEKNNLPTARYVTIQKKEEISEALKNFDIPVVLKADGLAAGKGVVIAQSNEEAKNTLTEFLEGKYGEASKKIVVEEFLDGGEISLISLWDGKTLLPMIPARDYKKLMDGNQGPNTGGMGAYCPVALTLDQENELNNYIRKLEQALRSENADFTGIVYSGLILTKNGLKVLEYNMRFGDPETQALVLHLESDLLYVFDKTARKELDKVQFVWKGDMSLCLVIAAKGYPAEPVKGGTINNIDRIEKEWGVNIFFAGVKKDINLVANGGRVLSICKTGLKSRSDVYKAAENLSFADKYYRNDIGVV